ncbi:MAG: tetratricopeptide repeat protein [Candidatus Saccharimonas sp.]|nr:tetratricopeptide repeat protein [Planctomycetaceae bacterium]
MGERPGMRPGSGAGLNPSQPGLWNKPGGGNKLPGNIGDNRPGGIGDNRPGGIGNNRPGGIGDNRPGGIGNNRPGGIGDNRPGGIGNRPGGIGDNRPGGIGNNNNYWNNGGSHGHYHGDWYHGSCSGNWYNRPAAWWGAGFISGAVVSSFMPYSWGYATYSNPYYEEPYAVGSTYVDYSQPIMTSAPAEPPANADPSTPAPPTTEDQASKWLGEARTAFYDADYATALVNVDQAIQKSPSDPVLHEFRGLVLFATKKYDQAAPTIYAVLSNGPGWDWTTLVSLYPSVDTYTKQLRALEQYRKANPQSAQARFVLAYHYLTGGHSAAALTEFKAVVKLQPTDQLSAQMVKTLTPPAEGEPAPASEDTAVATTPVEADKLVGSWKATQPDGSVVALTVSADKKFSWKFTQNKKPQEFTGTSTLADNLLILRPAEGPPLVGQVALLADNKLNFRLDANNPGDPGLTFVR